MPWLLSGPTPRGQKTPYSNCGSRGVPGSATNQNARAPPGASHGLCFPRLTERSLRIHALVKGPGVMAAGIHIYMGLYGMFPLNIP